MKYTKQVFRSAGCLLLVVAMLLCSACSKAPESAGATDPSETIVLPGTTPTEPSTTPSEPSQPTTATQPTAPTTPTVAPTLSPETFGTPVLRFAVTSDVHTRTTTNNYQSHDRLAQFYSTVYAYADAQEDYNKLDAIFFVGDITQNGKISEYTQFFNYVNANTRADTVVQAVLGNHEFYDTGKYNATSMKESPIRFMEQSGDDSVDIHQVIGGYHFITIGMDTYSKNTNTYFSNAKIVWLKEQLDIAVADDPNKPIFVFQHEPPKNTVIGSYGTNGDVALKTILNRYPQVIDFSGHSHRPLTTPRTIWQDTFTAVNTGSLAYLCLPLPDHSSYVNGGPIATDKEGSWTTSYEEGERNGVMYLFVEIDQDGNVRIQIYNMETQSIWGDAYIIDSLDPKYFRYTDARKDVSDTPVFADDAALTLRGLTHQSVAINIPQAYSKDVVQDYRVELYQNGELKNTIYRLSCTYYGDATPEFIRASFGKLEPATAYTIKVYAVNSWAKESEPLVLDFTTKAEGDNIDADILNVSFRADGAAINAITGEVLRTFGTPSVTYDETLGKYVASFDGKDDAYTYEGITGWYTTMAQGYSLEAYVYLAEKPASSFMDFASNLNSSGFAFGYKSDGKLYFYGSIGSTSYTTVSAAVTPGQWIHAVGTYDGAYLRLYINGQLAAETAITGDLNAPSYASRFFGIGADSGKNNESLEYMFKGTIADVKIYSADLSAKQIVELYNNYKK